MRFGVVTIFPDMIKSALNYGVIGRGIKEGLVGLTTYNPRDHGEGKYKAIDDKVYGGGAGMVLTVNPLRHAIKRARQELKHAQVIYLSPQGEVLEQNICNELSNLQEIILISGRYEGIDQRVIELDVDREISVGDYVLSGGEPAAIVLIDSVARLLPGIVSNSRSILFDSHVDNLLEGPQFTRPPEAYGLKVPEVLLSGDHSAIEDWRRREALGLTSIRRPDKMKKVELSDRDIFLLEQYQKERK